LSIFEQKASIFHFREKAIIHQLKAAGMSIKIGRSSSTDEYAAFTKI
jgi:hypothetical protein